MNISLRQLQAFSNVARYGTFVKAAEQMSLSQAALSNLLRELEATLGFKVFHRTTRSVRLTTTGEAFLPYVDRVLTNLDNAHACAQALAEGKSGIVRIATTEVLASTHLMSIIARYQDANPGVQVIMKEALSDKVATELEEEKVDLALGPERVIPDGVAAVTVFTTRLVMLCSPSHPLSSRSSVTWNELRDHHVLLAKGGSALRMAIDTNSAIQLDPANEIEHFTTLMAQTSLGKHVAITTAYIAPFLPVYNLRMIPLVEPDVERRVLLYRHASDKQELSQAAKNFADYLMRQFNN